MDIHEFIFWGGFGMLVEICFTALRVFIVEKKLSLVGHTSLWMFPVYALGLTYGFDFILYLFERDVIRWLSYPFWVWLVELAIGLPAVWLGIRIWDYRYLPKALHWSGIVSFVHYPLWMGFGILVELIK